MPKVSQKLVEVEENQQVSSFEDIFNEYCDNLVDEDVEVDILTFIESPFYLNIKTLQPAQRFILKVFYHLPFNDTKRDILIRSFPYDEEGKLFTEKEYAQYLINQKRINIESTSIDEIFASSELLLACGRRGGKTFIASIISTYESYKLIIKDNPQAYYKMAEDEKIKIVNVASSGDQALELSTQIQNRIFNCEWFLPYIASFNNEEINLKTKHDIKKMKEEEKRYGKPLKKRASIKIESLLCSARGSRGGSVIVALFDELAHFVDNEGNRGGKKVYESLTPSGATFGKDSKIIDISSPNTKSGVFYDIYTKSFEDQDTRMLQMPTWEMNVSITFEWLQNRYKKNPDSYWTEFGAQFSTTVSGFFKFPEKIRECVSVIRYDEQYDDEGQLKKIPVYRPETDRQTGRYKHYIALDPATNNNGYALAMVHCEKDSLGRLIAIVDKWKRWHVDDPEFSEFDFIDIEFIDNYVLDLTRNFRVAKIVYDQFESAASIQKFVKAGIDATKTHFSRQYNMKIYKNLRSIIYDRKISLLYNKDGIDELIYLQEKKVGKKEFVVEAPKSGDVVTDDLADVLANVVAIAMDDESDASAAKIISTSVVSRSAEIGMANVNLGRKGRSDFDKLIYARQLGIMRTRQRII